MASNNLTTIFKYIDDNYSTYKDRLADSIKIQSVSGWHENREIVQKQIQIFASWIVKLGGTFTLKDLGTETTEEGTEIPIPKPCFGTLGTDSSKKTILIYGHLDVQPASKDDDGWDTDPFTLVDINDVLYGRGTTDDKGPCWAWINAIEAYQNSDIELPVNFKFLFEGMEESAGGSLTTEHVSELTSGVDFVCISDSYWLGKSKPCLTYGLRGVSYFFITVTCAAKNLHSGVYGGSVHEAMGDLIYLMNGLSDVDGKITIPGISDDVVDLTLAEASLYKDIEFDPEEFRNDIGAEKLLYPTKEEILQHRWRYPSLSLHGISGASSNDAEETVIPAEVVGKFSIRTVPNMRIPDVETKVKQHIKNLWDVRGSPNKMEIKQSSGDNWWLSVFNSDHFEAAKRATALVHDGVQPDLIREGGSIPITLTLQQASGKSTLLLPFGRSDDGAHSQNEKFDKSNFVNGMKLAAAYFEEVGKLT